MKKKFQAGFFLGRFSGKQHTILDQKIDDWKSDISVFLKPTTYEGWLVSYVNILVVIQSIYHWNAPKKCYFFIGIVKLNLNMFALNLLHPL